MEVYNRLEKSAVLAGRPGVFTRPAEFSISNVVMAPAHYAYEGNWLFCSFDHSEVLAARVGFGRGKMDWSDYGLDQAPATEHALFARTEIVTAQGIYAHVSSSPTAGEALKASMDDMDISFADSGQDLLRLNGWPKTRWVFQNPEKTLTADLTARLDGMVVWPDCVMRRNIFGMCLGTARVEGAISIEGRKYSVSGSAIYDHPRILLQQNDVPLFGWYLYSPIRFADGTQLACYYSEDGDGQKDSAYSAGLVRSGDGKTYWLGHCDVAGLEVDDEGLPTHWEIRLRGEDADARFKVRVRQLPLARGWGDAHPANGEEKYVAYPLLMEVEGEIRLEGRSIQLDRGRGIAEFLVRKGFCPRFP